jgi:hypothetical protein
VGELPNQRLLASVAERCLALPPVIGAHGMAAGRYFFTILDGKLIVDRKDEVLVSSLN